MLPQIKVTNLYVSFISWLIVCLAGVLCFSVFCVCLDSFECLLCCLSLTSHLLSVYVLALTVCTVKCVASTDCLPLNTFLCVCERERRTRLHWPGPQARCRGTCRRWWRRSTSAPPRWWRRSDRRRGRWKPWETRRSSTAAPSWLTCHSSAALQSPLEHTCAIGSDMTGHRAGDRRPQVIDESCCTSSSCQPSSVGCRRNGTWMAINKQPITIELFLALPPLACLPFTFALLELASCKLHDSPRHIVLKPAESLLWARVASLTTRDQLQSWPVSPPTPVSPLLWTDRVSHPMLWPAPLPPPVHSPSSCGSSWQKTAMEVAMPTDTLEEKAAPMASPSAKLCTASPIMIITDSALSPASLSSTLSPCQLSSLSSLSAVTSLCHHHDLWSTITQRSPAARPAVALGEFIPHTLHVFRLSARPDANACS